MINHENIAFYDGKAVAYRRALETVRRNLVLPAYGKAALIQELTDLLAEALDNRAIEDGTKEDGEPWPS